MTTLDRVKSEDPDHKCLHCGRAMDLTFEDWKRIDGRIPKGKCARFLSPVCGEGDKYEHFEQSI